MLRDTGTKPIDEDVPKRPNCISLYERIFSLFFMDSNPEVQSKGHKLASSCAAEGVTYLAGNVLIVLATDVQECVTGWEVSEGLRTLGAAVTTPTPSPTPVEDSMTTSTSTGGGFGYRAKETGSVQVVAAAAIAAVGVMGVVGLV
ncbi:hypothetical protein QBC38DRAFT_452484 [Podospora fimiseda]|uniref:Uncharacterized protein n=1 Tax=Podospora fimiseda TaxID=252190 RepID=A0AAN7H6V7_9PEZI|nr:hypothetical protein QBC38DRAFT_452484 [Podospora fimiseda]